MLVYTDRRRVLEAVLKNGEVHFRELWICLMVNKARGARTDLLWNVLYKTTNLEHRLSTISFFSQTNKDFSIECFKQ